MADKLDINDIVIFVNNEKISENSYDLKGRFLISTTDGDILCKFRAFQKTSATSTTYYKGLIYEKQTRLNKNH